MYILVSTSFPYTLIHRGLQSASYSLTELPCIYCRFSSSLLMSLQSEVHSAVAHSGHQVADQPFTGSIWNTVTLAGLADTYPHHPPPLLPHPPRPPLPRSPAHHPPRPARMGQGYIGDEKRDKDHSCSTSMNEQERRTRS